MTTGYSGYLQDALGSIRAGVVLEAYAVDHTTLLDTQTTGNDGSYEFSFGATESVPFCVKDQVAAAFILHDIYSGVMTVDGSQTMVGRKTFTALVIPAGNAADRPAATTLPNGYIWYSVDTNTFSIVDTASWVDFAKISYAESGMHAQLPAVGNDGRLYFARDHQTLHLDTGSVWIHLYGHSGNPAEGDLLYFYPTAGIQLLRNLAIGTQGQLLRVSSAGRPAWSATAPQTYYRTQAQVAVTDTVAETTLASTTLTGNDLGTAGALLISLAGTLLNNVSPAADITYTIRVKLGAQTLLTFVHDIAADGTSWAWELEAKIHAVASAAIQKASGKLSIQATVTTAGASDRTATRVGSGTIDTTADQTLAITGQMSAIGAGANHVSITKEMCLVSLQY